MTGLAVKLNNVGKPTPCASCAGWADPPVGFAASLSGEGELYVCDDCLQREAPALALLLAGYLVDSTTTDDPYATDLAWQEAFVREGYLDAREAFL